MPVLEPNFNALWLGKQTAKGTPNTTPGQRFIQVGGDFQMPRDDGSENWSDLRKYGAYSEWVNSLLGNGEPIIEATPTELAYLNWLFHGGETVTSVTGPPAAQKHTVTPSLGRGHYFTAFVRVGQSVVRRHRFDDNLITKMVYEGSTANKAVRVTPTILSLDPGAIFTSDPTQALPTDKVLLYTDSAGAFTIDGTVFNGQSSFQLTIDDAWSPVFGDDSIPFDVVQGLPSVSLSVTCYFDSVALAEVNTLVYGSASPTAGTKPRRYIPATGSYSFYLKQKDNTGALNGREFKLTLPAVKWTAPDYPGPNPDGGVTEVTFGGQMRPPDLTDTIKPYTIDVNTANSVVAFTT